MQDVHIFQQPRFSYKPVAASKHSDFTQCRASPWQTDFVCVYLCTTSQLSEENVFLQVAPTQRVGIITTREVFQNRMSTIWDGEVGVGGEGGVSVLPRD